MDIKRGQMGKRGSVTLIVILIATVLALSTSVYLATKSDLITGASIIGIETVQGDCNFEISSDIGNLGHDYECNTTAFNIVADDVSFDCQGHYIKCIAPNCINFSGIVINGHSNAVIQNCYFYNWGKGIYFINGTSNNVTLNHFNNNTYNVFIKSAINSAFVNQHKVWNNNFTLYNYSGYDNGTNAWNLNRTCPGDVPGDTTNIIGGPCLGGNFWDAYTGKDVNGDGLGDVPYNISGGINKDNYPLVDPNGSCPGGSSGWSVNTNLNEDFQSDALGECFALTGDNIVLDCQGHSITGINGTEDHQRGIEIVSQNNVTIKNCIISNFTWGIYVRNSNNITLLNNIVQDNYRAGIHSDNSKGFNSTNNTVRNYARSSQQYGIWLKTSIPKETSGLQSYLSLNTVYNNTLSGIYLSDSSDHVTMSQNNVYNNTEYGILVNGSFDVGVNNNTVYNNNKSGIGLLNSDSDSTATCNANSIFKYNAVYNNTEHGIYLDNTIGYNLYRNTVTNYSSGYYGVYLLNANDNVLQRNTVAYGNNGSKSQSSDGVRFCTNNFYNNTNNALIINTATSGSSFDNNITKNNNGILITSSIGLSVYSNDIINNTGTGMIFTSSNLSSVYSNNISLNSVVGINLSSSSINNILYDNYFNNTINAEDLGSNNWNTSPYLAGCTESASGIFLECSNISQTYCNSFSGCSWSGSSCTGTINGGCSLIADSFDCQADTSDVCDYTGYNIIGGTYFGGNFWDNYTGIDFDGDGLGDTPYNITSTNIDYHPLVPVNISCGTISNSINLNSNFTSNGTCFTVDANNVVINCQGNTLIGNGSGTGVYLYNVTNVTVENCYMTNFTYGVNLIIGSGHNLTNNIIYNNSDEGIRSVVVANTTIYNNVLLNNNYGLYLSNSNNFSIFSNNLTNNSIGIGSVGNSSLNNLIYLNIIKNNNYGISFDSASNNNIYSNTIKDNAINGLYFDTSNNNTIYNNYFNNDNNTHDNGNNYWNTTYQAGANIIGGSFIGGNYWSNYAGSDSGSGSYPHNNSNDGIGDTLLPYSNSNSISNGGDYLPLLTHCGMSISGDILLTQNLTSIGDCFTVTANNVVIDCQGFFITGDNSGSAIIINNKSGITVKNCNFLNFTNGIFVDPSSSITIDNMNISNMNKGIYFEQTTLSTIKNSRIYNNDYGIYLNTSSTNNTILNNTIYNNNVWGSYFTNSGFNTIYNNNFTNTNNVYSDANSNNSWNTSYSCPTSVNIIGGNCTGGNYWSNYVGTDSGTGISPYNILGDGIGDTNIPYNSNIAIGGDYLPLTSVNGTVVSCPITITSDSVLANDITCSNEGNAIVMGANGITLDCSNNIITGLGTDAGIYVNSKSNVVIKNCNITNFYYGIEIINSDNVQINSSNYLYENDFYAIYQYNSTNTKVVGNRIINDNNGIYSINSQNTLISGNTINLQKKFYGIYSFGSSGSLIENNTMFDNYHGIYLVNSDSTTANNNNISSSDVYSLYLHSTTDNSNFANNTLSAGQEGIRIKSNSNFNTFTSNNITDHSNYGLHSTDSSSNKFISNNFVNNSVTAATSNIYLSNSPDYNFTNDVIVNGSKGAVIIDSSNNLFLSLNTINATNKPSLQVNDSSSPILKNNTIYSNAELNNADNAVISPGNTISTNLTLTNSDNVTIDNNNLQNVYITNSDDSTISNNILKILKLVNFGSGTVNTNDIDNVVGTSFDFQIVTSSNIYDNNIQSVTNAIVLSNSSNSNNLYDNWLKDNTIGLNITSSTGNNIYNNYFNNVQNVFDDSGNNWNSSYTCAAPNIIGGPCKGGNFYSNYAGLDNGANNREQGDGIGDQPPTHTIAAGTFDYLPLVLYVARQYYAPDYPYNETFVAYGNVSGYLTDGEVVPNQVQKINYTNSNNAYLELTALFNQSDVHAETLKIDFNANKTAVNKTGVTGIASNYNVYLSHNYEFDYGVYVCEEKYNLSLDETCSPRIDLTAIGTDASGLVLGQSGNHYIVSNIRNNSVTAGINKNGLCNASILHDVTLTQNISCNGNAFIVKADNIIIDFAGYILTGNSSGIGVNISNYNGVVIKNANIVNFSTAIHADPAEGINITNSNISSSSIGIKFDQINKSFITNNFIRNNNIGINLSSSYNNTIYNNYFNNTNNVVDDGINTYNVSNVTGTNILCTAITAFNLSITCNENAFGGNFWSNYNGWDTDLDGVGETLLPYNNSNSVTTGGDYLPLTEVGKIACGGTVQNVTTNITLNRNLSTTGTCFTIGAGNIILDGAGFTILGNTSGYGINNSAGFDNITIKNFAINNFTNGIRATGMVNSNIFNNTIESANVSNGYGIYLYSSSNNTLLSNTITTSGNSGLGIFFQSSINNSLRSNTVTTFGSDGRGINLYSSSNNTLLSNTITTSGNSGLGVFLYSSSNNNTLLSNIITTSGSNGHGIFLGISSNNILLSNTVTTSGNGGYGIYFPSSVNNSDVQNNTITTNSSGIRISSSNNNTIHTNTITNNPLGINITSSYNNTIYNNYFNNTNNAWDNGTNYWNTTYVCSSSTINILGGNCTGGNYWSNYAGEDNGNATYPGLPNVTDDGIGDTEIPYNNSDNFTGGDYLPLVATSVCGNLVKESSEACDGSDFGGLSCIDYGYLYGSLSCTSCTIVSSACTNTSGSSSSSSSTSSGGGGGGGGAAALAQCNDKKDNDNDGKTDYPNDPGCESNNDNDETDPLSCKQNWQCGSWSACTNDLQKRTCYDINDCLSKKNAGEVDEIVVVLKPVESKKCEAEEVILPPEVPKQPSPPTEKELIVLPEIITKPGPVRTIALTSLILTGLLGGIYAFWQLGHTPNRLRRKIRRLSPLLEEEPSELLKEDYLDAYKLYLKLSEKNKQNFYPKITQLREKIETQLKAEKRIEELFKKVVQGGIEEQKKTYLKIFKDYQKLPEKVKQKYYTKIIQLRDRLERGG